MTDYRPATFPGARQHLQLEEGPAEVLRRGSVFFEPPDVPVHRFGNLSANEPAAFIAFYLLTGDQPLIAAVGPHGT